MNDEPNETNTVKEAEEDKALADMINQVSETNKKIDDNYDEKIKRLNEKKKLTPDEKEKNNTDEKILLLKEKLNELTSMISDARRKGKDPFIAGLMLRNIKAKMKMAEITNENHDFEVVENIIKDAAKELEETLKEEKLDVKKEIAERLKEELGRKKADATNENGE